MLDPSSFAYDQQAPLALEVKAERAQDGAMVRDITYASPHGGKVPAYLIVPSQQKPQAGLIFGHWGEGNREEFVQEAIVLARLGFVSLIVPFRQRRGSASLNSPANQNRSPGMNTVVMNSMPRPVLIVQPGTVRHCTWPSLHKS